MVVYLKRLRECRRELPREEANHARRPQRSETDERPFGAHERTSCCSHEASSLPKIPRPKPNPPPLTFQSAAPPSSTTAADSFSTDWPMVFPAHRNNDATKKAFVAFTRQPATEAGIHNSDRPRRAFDACAESLASENASRLAAMQCAEKNIEDILEDLNRTFRRVRQESIDEELFDVISGFEALTGRRRHA